MNFHKIFGLLILLIIAAPMSAQAQTQIAVPDNTKYQWVQISSGFNSPLFITNVGDGSGRLFVVEQDGFIFVLQNGVYDDTKPFLDISNLLSKDVFQGGYTERGLLGLAFHPDFKNNDLFFINHTDVNGDTVIARYHVDPANPNQADPNSRVELLKIHQPFYDHNGGGMAFGPDGYLYIGVGDGGSQGDDPGSTGQKLTTLLGKMLRIDVNADTYTIPPSNPFVGKADALPEIWAYGLRNPWRFSFDRMTGDLYIADVGQASYEEIDYQPADDPGGENYGWYDFEGMHPYKSETPPPNMTMPVAEYPHLVGCAVTGGYVYRGSDLPELRGIYFFGDYCSGHTWSMFRSAAGNWKVQPFTPSEKVISSFGEDEQGELYMVDYKGEILRLERAG